MAKEILVWKDLANGIKLLNSFLEVEVTMKKLICGLLGAFLRNFSKVC